MISVDVLEAGWKKHLKDQFDLDYMLKLQDFLLQQQRDKKIIYPAQEHIFNAFNSAPFTDVKVVILGQDPYHGEGQAHGLCFSVLPDVRVPPSLKNIYKELHADLDLAIPEHGYLQSWAEQGVLLLNATLTVEQSSAGAHQGQGWETFTDRAIQVLSEQREGLVFLLWGSYAQKKSALINSDKHCILSAPHPSPLSAFRGFLGCKHFSLANTHLEQQGQTAIDWSLPELELSGKQEQLF